MANLRGIAYPLAIANGSLVLATDTDLIKGHIISVLETEPLERVMRPGYGTPDFLFNAVQDIHLIAQYVRQALEREIAATFEVTGSLDDSGAGVLSVLWSVDGVPQPPLNFELAN